MQNDQSIPYFHQDDTYSLHTLTILVDLVFLHWAEQGLIHYVIALPIAHEAKEIDDHLVYITYHGE
jgi:hypothetical protein